MQQDYQFLDEYFNLVEEYYAGKVITLNFEGDPGGSRTTINSWVEDQTNDKIKDLIPSGAISSLTKLVLTNAIYFKGEWAKHFNKTDTRNQSFRTAPDNTIKVPMMQRTDNTSIFNYTGKP